MKIFTNTVNKNILLLFLLTLETIVGITMLYYIGMIYLENDPTPIIECLEFVVQTMTTVGYGQHATWNHPLMFALVMWTQLAGITLVFLSIPIVVTPWIEQRIAIRPPETYNGPEEFVLITEHTEIMNRLIQELEARDIDYVLVDPDSDEVTRLHHDGYSVMLGNPADPETLENANIRNAGIAILDGPDQQNASVALALQEFDHDLSTIAIAGESDRAAHLSMAGVDEVVSPRQKIGTVLAVKALSGLGQVVGAGDTPPNEIQIQEFPVLSLSPLLNVQLRNSGIREKTGSQLIGVWRHGNFNHNPPSDYRIRRNDILVAAGTYSQLQKLGKMTESRPINVRTGQKKVLLIGYGREGHSAYERLSENGITPRTINDVELENVDVVGDAMDPQTLRKANIQDMATVIITVSADDVAIMITLITKKLNPDAEILVQVNQSSSIEPIYRAGASYVQALDQLTSRMLAESVMGEEVVQKELNVEIRETGAGDLSGRSLKQESIRERYDISIIAVERDENLVRKFSPTFQFQDDDTIYVAGSTEAVNKFCDEYQTQPPD